MKREPGFYWVKTVKGWEIAQLEYLEGVAPIWTLFWYYDYPESDFKEIDKYPIVRQPQCKMKLK